VAGSIAMSGSQFVSGGQSANMQGVQFRGNAASGGSSGATVDVDSSVTRGAEFGCRNWAARHRVGDQGGRWLIAQTSITPWSWR
jgi:hypothetical protein